MSSLAPFLRRDFLVTVRPECMLVAWVSVMESEGLPREDQSQDPEVEHAAAMEILDKARFHVFALGRLQRVSEAKT